jgi:hypothetical protein
MNRCFFSVLGDGTVVRLLIVPCNTFRTVFDRPSPRWSQKLTLLNVLDAFSRSGVDKMLRWCKATSLQSDGKQNSGFNSSLEAKAVVRKDGCF